MIIGASSFASPLDELQREVESIELYVPKLGLYRGYKMQKERVDELMDFLSTSGTLASLHAPYYGDYPVELMVDTAHMGRTQFRLMEESIHLAGDLGCRVVVVHPGKILGDRETCFDQMVENLKRLSCEALDCGVVLGLENKEGTDPTNLCCTAEEHMRAVEEVGSQALQATFDIGHANLTCGGDMEKLRDFIRAVKMNVIHVHVHDNRGKNGEKFFGDEHAAPGGGNIDFSVLEELHVEGIYNLEVFSIEDVRTGKRMLSGMEKSHKYITS